jgi:signal transduction histidine kinase
MDQIHDLQVEASVEEDFRDLSVFVAGLLYRGIRELLFNVVKHAGVRKARLEVTRKNDQIQAVVSDEGQGCEDLVPENFGRGLQHLAERTDAAGGSLDVVTATGDGCRVTIRIPLAALEHMTGQEVQ